MLSKYMGQKFALLFLTSDHVFGTVYRRMLVQVGNTIIRPCDIALQSYNYGVQTQAIYLSLACHAVFIVCNVMKDDGNILLFGNLKHQHHVPSDGIVRQWGNCILALDSMFVFGDVHHLLSKSVVHCITLATAKAASSCAQIFLLDMAMCGSR